MLKSIRGFSLFCATTFAVMLSATVVKADDYKTLAEQKCKSFPYSVGNSEIYGTATASLAAGAISALNQVPKAQVSAAMDISNTAYSGMAQQAMSEVLEAVRCRVEIYIKTQGVANPSAAVDNLNRGVAGIRTELARQAHLLKAGGANLDNYYDNLPTRTRPNGAPSLDPAILQAALAPYDFNALYIDVHKVTGWVNGQIGPSIQVGACGGLVRAAISDGGSALQVSMKDVPAIFQNYMDSSQTSGPATAFSMSIVDLDSAPTSNGTSAAAPGQGVANCISDLQGGKLSVVTQASASSDGRATASVIATATTPTTPTTPVNSGDPNPNQ